MGSYLNDILDQVEAKIMESARWTDGPCEAERMVVPVGLFGDNNRSSGSLVVRPRVMSTPEPEPETVTIKIKPKRKKKKSRKEIKRNRKATRLARKRGRRK